MSDASFKPLISVIVPVYNAQAFLLRCTDSVLEQTYRSIELVLVDDGSTDESGKLCDALESEDIAVRVIHQENAGLVCAWRSGVRESTGEYLFFIDSDDWIVPTTVETLVRGLDGTDKKQIVACNHVIDRADGSVPVQVAHAIAPGIYEGEELTEKVKKNILGNEERTIGMSRCMKLISRKLITDNIGWTDPNIRMGEDVAIMLPAILDAERVNVLPGHYDYHYYYNPASMVHAYDKTMVSSVHRLTAIIREVLKRKYGELGITDVDIAAMTQREYQYLFCLLIKNELRRETGGPAAAVRLIGERRMPARCARYPAGVKGAANTALFMLMKHPNEAYASVLREMMKRKAYQFRTHSE